MKRLTLIRHANADWKNPTVPDFDRPLNKRGISEAEAIGRQLLDAELVPDLLLTSPARRAQQTAEILAGKLALAPRRIKAQESLYLATPEDILALVHGTGPKVQHLAIVGHNPGISELAKYLAPGMVTTDLTTGAACALTFTARSWANIHPPAARAVRFQPPSKLFGLFT
ncbi:MAG TPA: histidine phosphatase family protein [Steroidobacteraceae bacterium]|nr:histidine phosphatase family protein [Steroidobacteraceae bacterium]